jgi:hypothetical protein
MKFLATTALAALAIGAAAVPALAGQGDARLAFPPRPH